MGWAAADESKKEECKVLAAQARQSLYKLKSHIEQIQHTEKREPMEATTSLAELLFQEAVKKIDAAYEQMYEVSRQLER